MERRNKNNEVERSGAQTETRQTFAWPNNYLCSLGFCFRKPGILFASSHCLCICWIRYFTFVFSLQNLFVLYSMYGMYIKHIEIEVGNVHFWYRCSFVRLALCVRVCNIHSLLAFSAYVIFCLPYYTIPVMFVYLHSVRHETLTRAKQLVKPKYNRNLFMNAIQNYKAILPVLCVRLESSRYAENEWQAICCESQGYGGSRKSSRNVPTNNVGENQSLYVRS